MTTVHPDHLVADYLRRLEAAASALPPERRTELIAEIRAHVEEALWEAGTSDEVTVRNVLERLGSPEEIANAAVGPSTAAGRTRGKLEIAALVALALSGVLPIVGWAIGVVLVLASGAWSTRDKAVGLTLGLLAALSVPAIAVAMPVGGGLGPFELLILVGWGVVSGPVSAAYLAYRLRRPSHPVVGVMPAASVAAGN